MRIGHANTDERALIVAEIGNNHEGDVSVAHRLVELAADCGAGAVKVQVFRTADFVSRSDEARYRRLQGFELTPQDFAALSVAARARGLAFIATPLDLASADALVPLVDAFKIASSDITFYPLLERVAASGKPVIISTGLSDLREVRETTAFIRRCWEGRGVRSSLAALHCVTAYPVPDDDLHLRAIGDMTRALDCEVGFSDHTIGIEAAVLSVACGATIVEKHVTLDKQYSDFRDHQLSADPADLRELVRRVRAAERLLGDATKSVSPAAAGSVTALRRSIAAARTMSRGHRIETADLRWTRPGGGLEPGREGELVGKTLTRDVADGDRLSLGDVVGEP